MDWTAADCSQWGLEMILNNYIYISDTKVDMFYAQIPPKALEGMAIEQKVDLKVVGMALSKHTPESTRYSKLKVVSAFIENHETIGTVDDPKEFFSGVMPMRWGPVGQDNVMVYFGGVTDRTILGLGGSLKHVIGSSEGTSDVERAARDFPSQFPSLPHSIYNSLKEVTSGVEHHLKPTANDSQSPLVESAFSVPNPEEDLQLIAYTSTRLNGSLQKCEFLAVRWQEGSYHKSRTQSRVLLGSPLYVVKTE
jgi:hypothetical protein